MKRFNILVFIFAITIFASCSNDFYQRRYLPGAFLKGPAKMATYNENTSVASESIGTEPEQPLSEVQPLTICVSLQSESEQIKFGDSIRVGKEQFSHANIASALYIAPTDTIPPPQLATPRELRTAQLIAAGCVIILTGSWFFLPVIGLVGLFLIHFVVGAVGLLAVAYGAENKNKFLNGLGVMIGISMAIFVLFGIFNLIYCTFIENCQT